MYARERARQLCVARPWRHGAPAERLEGLLGRPLGDAAEGPGGDSGGAASLPTAARACACMGFARISFKKSLILIES